MVIQFSFPFFSFKNYLQVQVVLFEALENTEFQETQEGEAGQPGSSIRFQLFYF